MAREALASSPTIPYLAGQYAHYTAFELQMWQRGFRRNSPSTMTLFAKLLGDQEIAALAAYYQQLAQPPRRRRRQRSDRDAGSTSHTNLPCSRRIATRAPIEADEAAQALRNGPIGAFVVASIAVGLLFIGWLAFYFLLFMPRGAIG